MRLGQKQPLGGGGGFAVSSTFPRSLELERPRGEPNFGTPTAALAAPPLQPVPYGATVRQPAQQPRRRCAPPFSITRSPLSTSAWRFPAAIRESFLRRSRMGSRRGSMRPNHLVSEMRLRSSTAEDRGDVAARHAPFGERNHVRLVPQCSASGGKLAGCRPRAGLDFPRRRIQQGVSYLRTEASGAAFQDSRPSPFTTALPWIARR